MKIDGPTSSFIEILHRLGQFVIPSNTSQLLNGSSFFNVTQQSIEHKLVLYTLRITESFREAIGVN